jgi:hypothetical protein
LLLGDPHRDAPVLGAAWRRICTSWACRISGQDMTAGVTYSVDESNGLVNAYVEVHEGTQYRVGNAEILGLGPKAENLLRSIQKPGQIFDSHSLTDFLKENRDALPVDASESDITIRSNSEDGTVEILLDFRRCSKAWSTSKWP